jgi:hypothetical protein
VAVARDDLRGHGLALEPQPRQHAPLELGVVGRVGADGAREHADGGLGEGALEPIRVAVGLHREPGELDPERRRLGVDPVRAPDAQRVAVLARALDQSGGQLARSGDDDLARAPQLQRERGDEPAGGRQPEGDPASRRAGGRREHIDERGDVVVGDTLALAYRVDREGSAADRVELLRGRSVRQLLAGRHLDLAPGLHARLVRPQAADLLARVAVDHPLSIEQRSDGVAPRRKIAERP